MLDFIEYYDRIIFHAINGEWRNEVADGIMPFMRKATNWIPLYVFLVGYIYFNFKKQFWKIVLYIALVAGITDLTSSHLIKKTVQRVRPCRETTLNFEVVKQISCSPGFSFTSSHAANHYALATALSLTIFRRKKFFQVLVFSWAAIIAYAQIYVGVHYPFDIFCGALLGMSIALFIRRFIKIDL